MTQIIDDLVIALAACGLTTWASGSMVYPVANVAHLLGLVLLLGSIGLIDLRVIGFFGALPLRPLRRALTPLGIAGLSLLFASGSLLFAADARGLVGSDTFLRKLIVIAAALANAAFFHRIASDSVGVTLAARIAAGVSLAGWLTVATLGRMIAYS